MDLTRKTFNKLISVFILLVLFTFSLGIIPVKANNTAATLSFSQNWSNTALITANDTWTNVPSIIGYRGDNLTAVAGTDPQTIVAGDDTLPVVNVIANQSNTNLVTGGVAEFDLIANPTIALNGSGTADAPYIKIFLNTTNANNIRISYDVRDLDGSIDNAVQPVALQYRTSSSGVFTNIPTGYIADATTGPSLAALVTPVSVTLPAAVDNKPVVELRIMTANAAGNDEWVGIDNISVAINNAPAGYSISPSSVLENQPAGTTVGTLIAIDSNVGDTHTFALVNSVSCSGNGADNANFSIIGNVLKTGASFDYETKTNYLVCVKVTDNNGLSATDSVYTINILDIADETPPTVTIDQAFGQVDPTNASPINFTVVFSEPVIGFTTGAVTLSGTAGITTGVVAAAAPFDGTTYNVAVSGMATSGTVIANIVSGMATDATGNANSASTSGDNTVTYSTDTSSPVVLFSVNTNPANASVLLAGPTQMQIEFNEDVKNDASAGAANNTANYLLVEAGTNSIFDTKSCSNGLVADDVKIPVNIAAYNNNSGSGPFIATLNINGGVPLAPGSYRLLVCGTTSIEDLLGNKLNIGTSDTPINFTVSQLLANSNPNSRLPVTGFPMGHITSISVQPADKTYASFSDLRLEIPKLKVSMLIVGVPLSKDGWDVTWLGRNAGWLNETAFPTWAGNSVITAHVWDAYNQPGIFFNLKKLQYGDFIKVHAFGQVYIYEVRQTRHIAPDNFNAALKHEEKAWLTLLTCEDYKVLFQTYSYRRMVRAVLISVAPEK